MELVEGGRKNGNEELMEWTHLTARMVATADKGEGEESGLAWLIKFGTPAGTLRKAFAKVKGIRGGRVDHQTIEM